MFQASSIKPSNNTIIWNNNNINGNININNNYSSENLTMMNPIKRTRSLNFKNSNTISSQNYNNHFKQIKLGNNNNINKIKTNLKPKKNYMESNYNTRTEGNNNEMEMTHAKNYINYLYEHLDTSYNANSELSNKTEMILNMKKDIENEIKRNNDVYKSLILSYNDKLKMNNKYKNEFINFLNLYKKQYKDFNIEINDKTKQLDDLVNKNKELKKEIKYTEEIINYLKKTENIMMNNNKLVEKDHEEKNEMELLKKELMKLKEIKDNENKFLEKMKDKNIKFKEKLEEVKKDNNNNNKNNNIKNINNKVRNKKFIVGGNKLKKNSLDYNNNLKTDKDNNNDNIKSKNELIQNNSAEKEKEEEAKKDNEKENIAKNEEKNEENEVEKEEEIEIDIDLEKIKEKKISKEKNNKKKKIKKKSKLKEKVLENELIMEKPKKKKRKSKIKEENISPEKEEINDIKEYELSDNISDNVSKKNTKKKSKKEENIEYPEEKREKTSPNSLSLDEVSSIKSLSKTQKKLSQSQESIIEILTTPLKGSYLYTITPKGKLLSFNIAHKKFAIIDSSIIDGWTSFIPNYLKNIEGSLLLNTLEGLFIITGNNHNDLYFYSQEKCLIAKITTFKCGHKYGGLLLSPSPDNNLFVIGGECPNNEVELLSFEDDQNKMMPNLLTKRINASYTFINYKLYAIFGKDNNTIEYLNIKKLKNNWNKIEYQMDEGKINNIYGHVSLPVKDNNILIVGGKNNKKMMVLDLDEKTLDITDMKIPFIDSVGDYLFDKEKFFNQTISEENKDKEGKNIKQLIGMDSCGNIHLFDYNFNYVVLLIKNNNDNNSNDKEK